MNQIPRRTLLTAGPLALAACRAAEGAYFGKTDPPDCQRLVAVVGAEPGSLDPTTSVDLAEEKVIFALFEGLTTPHPLTGQAMAGLATHYEMTSDGLRYTFYIRGHPGPRGTRLMSRDDLPIDYSRGLPAVPDSKPARWSDGSRITAHDFVYAWRRSIHPATASPYAYLMYCIVDAEEINTGKRSPETLGVRSLDELTLDVELRAPAPYFLQLVATKWFCPVPRNVIEKAGKTWTVPGRMVSSGAFALRERKPGEKLVLTKNPYYYEAAAVLLEELVFLPIIATTASTNLYRTAGAAMTPVTPTLTPVLQHKEDYRPTRVFGVMWAFLKTKQPPFTDARVRYAFNMATDKRAIADMIPGQKPALTLVPPMQEYKAPASLRVAAGNSEIDVLAFNPRAARELMESALGRSRIRITLTHPTFADFRLTAIILQQQWRQTLGIELELEMQDVAAWIQSTYDKSLRGIVLGGDAGPYVDPAFFLEQFISGSAASGSDWEDAQYDRLVAEAAAMVDRERRLQKLSQCESHLLSAMPIVPLSASVWPSLAKPYVKGLGTNFLDRQQFKYVWIDINWRPS